MNSVKWFGVCAVAVLALGWSLAVPAQSAGGGIQGRVTDETGNPVPNAALEVSGGGLPGVEKAKTGPGGNYVFPFLPADTGYTVKVTAEGYNTILRKGVEIPLGVNVSLPFTLSKGSTEIVVTAAAPTIDRSSTGIGSTISNWMTDALPLGRQWTNVAYMTPSALPSGLDRMPAIAGASGVENVYIVNGVDVTESRSALNLTALNADYIQAAEIKTGGIDPEYGALMGGAVIAVTKSGGNEFHGGIYAYYYDESLGAKEHIPDNPFIVNYIKSFKHYDLGGSLGGYFVKDKLWFFAAYNYTHTETGNTANGADPKVFFNGQPSYSAYQDTGYVDTEKDPQYAFKLTWNASPNHKLAFSAFGDTYERDYHRWIGNPVPVASPTLEKTDNYTLGLQWNATWTPRFFTEAVLGYRSTKDRIDPENALARNSWWYYYRYYSRMFTQTQVIPVGPPNSFDPATGVIDLASWRPSYGGGYLHESEDTNAQLRLKGTNLFTGAGRHELSYGFQYYDIHFDENENYTGPGFTSRHTELYDPSTGLYIENPFLGRTTTGGAAIRWHYYRSSPTSYRWRAQGFMNDQNKKTTQRYAAYWVQDNWSLTDYFMLKLGVRLDQLDMRGGDNHVNVPSQQASQGGSGAPRSNGVGRKLEISDMWAPRVGFTWDVAHNSKSKLYGFFGQYYERIPNDVAVRALTDEYFLFEYFNDPQLTQPSSIAYCYGLGQTQIKAGPKGGNLKGQYNEEWLLGFQYEVRPDLTLGARAIYRSIGRVIEDITSDWGYSYIVTDIGNWADVWMPDPARPGYRYRYPKPVRIYKALELTADKRFSNHWVAQGFYVLSRLEGNYEGLYSNDNGQLDPNITSKFDLPNLSVNGYGLLPNDRTHVLALYGAYFFESIPLELSAGFTLASGTPISKLGADFYYGINEGFCTPRGTAGRTPTIWDLAVGVQYTFPLWKSSLAVRVDVFNVTNEQRTMTVDQCYNDQSTADVQTYPYFKAERTHQPGRRVRLALRWTF